jgi:glyoxylase-like metal-dependent hydrolase (beta-lactamase superfamily II)
VILIDSGLGPKANGSLTASLTAGAVSPIDITDVLITHSHGDHVGGLVTSDGKLAFPNATIRMSAPEWKWMKTQANSADLVEAIDGHVQTFTAGASIFPGVTSVYLGGGIPRATLAMKSPRANSGYSTSVISRIALSYH